MKKRSAVFAMGLSTALFFTAVTPFTSYADNSAENVVNVQGEENEGLAEFEAYASPEKEAALRSAKQKLAEEITVARAVKNTAAYAGADQDAKENYDNVLEQAERIGNLPEPTEDLEIDIMVQSIERAINDLKAGKAALVPTNDTDLRGEIAAEETVKKSIKFKFAAPEQRSAYENAIRIAKDVVNGASRKTQRTINESLDTLRTAKRALTGVSQQTNVLNEQIREAETAKNGNKYRNAAESFKNSYEAVLREVNAVHTDEWASEEDVNAAINKLRGKLEELGRLNENGSGNQNAGGSNNQNAGGSGSGGNNSSTGSGGTGNSGRGGSGGSGSGRSGRAGSGGGGARGTKLASGAGTKTGTTNLSPAKIVTTDKASLNSGKWANVGGKWKLETSAEVTNSKISFASNQWAKLDSKWYVFDKDEYMCTGLVKVDNVNYYFNADGSMATAWVKIANKWYYFDTVSGAMKTGWVNTNDKWYFLKSDGSMAVNESTSDGYKVDTNGVWIK